MTEQPDSDAERRAAAFIKLLIVARKHGATVRTLAKVAGVSKSTVRDNVARIGIRQNSFRA